MLNGVAPILIFTFPVVPKSPAYNALVGIPFIGQQLADNIGVPIPIYLDEKLTGIYIDSESKALDIETTVEAKDEAGKPDVRQRGLNNIVTVNLVALRDSILLGALLAFNDMIFQRVVSQEYSVSYLNGPTTIFNGLLHQFNTSVDTDTDLMRVSIQISKANQNKATPDSGVGTLTKITGATPAGAG